ncbi:MAG: hypothetical protein FWH37_07030 [Candidatus Bathyarchaeota archaeon]|nr:hypothetical protein [Candidatus Termiticorpusculum sp.]
MRKPKIFQDFTVEDIRKIRDYAAERMDGWTAEKIIKYTQDRTRELLEYLESNKVSTMYMLRFNAKTTFLSTRLFFQIIPNMIFNVC